MAKKTVTNDKAKKTDDDKETPDVELIDMTGKRAVFVHVEKLEPATVIVEDTPGWEQEARETYRKLRNFISTKNPWTVRDVTDGHQEPKAAGPGVSDDEDIDVKV